MIILFFSCLKQNQGWQGREGKKESKVTKMNLLIWFKSLIRLERERMKEKGESEWERENERIITILVFDFHPIPS